MIRFLIGTILAIVVFWMALFTLGMCAMIAGERHHTPAVQQRR